MAKLTPQQAREKHARRLKGATEDIRIGVNRVTVAPGQQAIAKQDKMRQNLMDAIDSGKWKKGLERVSLEDWRTKMINKGIPRIAAGVDDSAGKIENFFADLFVHQDRLKGELEKMPDMTLEDSIQRMVTFTRGMAKFKRS